MLTSVFSLPSFPMWQQPYTPILTGRWPHRQVRLPPSPQLDFPHQLERLCCLSDNSQSPWLWHFKSHVILTHLPTLPVPPTTPSFPSLPFCRLWLPVIISVIKTVAPRQDYFTISALSKGWKRKSHSMFQKRKTESGLSEWRWMHGRRKHYYSEKMTCFPIQLVLVSNPCPTIRSCETLERWFNFSGT